MAQAGLDDLLPETADQARFIIQAQGLIDPAIKGQLLHNGAAAAILLGPPYRSCVCSSARHCQASFQSLCMAQVQ